MAKTSIKEKVDAMLIRGEINLKLVKLKELKLIAKLELEINALGGVWNRGGLEYRDSLPILVLANNCFEYK